MPDLTLRVGHGRQTAGLAFPQQGQIDWVAFGRTIYSASFAVMQRLAAAGVQPITHGAGLALAYRFQVSDIGTRRMNEALESLRIYPAFDAVILFGFGYQSFVKLLAETELGIRCIALCSCLVETHSEELAAWVLRELWSTNKFPKEYEPSYAQFLALVKANAGVVAGTTFGETVYIMLGEDRKSTIELSKGASGARDIANTLHGLFQISRGDTESIMIVGGADCAFIAAFAYWLLDLSVHVEDEDEKLIFTSVPARESAQVKVQYVDISQRAQMQIASSTYILGDHKEMLQFVEQSAIFNLVARTPWQGCFTRIFGLSFQKLISNPHLLRTFLGSYARIATAFVSGEARGEGFECSNYINFTEASYGKGFLESVTTLFPEFSKARDLAIRMQEAEEESFHAARATIEQTIRSVKLICGCPGCSGDYAGTSNVASQNSSKACLIAILGTTKRLVTLLSCVETDSVLRPTVSGIESVYKDIYGFWSTRSSRDENFWATLLDPQRNDHFYMIQDIHLFFVGTEYQQIETLEQPSPHWNSCTATSEKGICIYLNSLTSLSAKAELMRKVHVVRGHIQWGNNTYSSVWDAISWNNEDRQVIECAKASRKFTSTRHYQDDGLELKGLVTERSSGNRLHFYYRSSLPSGEFVSLQPGATTERVLRNTGNLRCEKHRCGDSLAFPSSYITKGWVLDNKILDSLQFHAGIACCIWPLGNDIARCIAIQMIYDAKTDWNNRVFLRQTQCLPRCTLSILRQSSELLSYTMAPGPKAVAWIIS